MRKLVWVAGGLVGAVALPFGVGCCAFSAPPYRGPVSDHFDGKRFRNPDPVPEHGFGDLVKWRVHRKPGVWHDSSGAGRGPTPPARVGNGRLRVTYVNHATLLIQVDSLNILTDPIWSERCSPVSWAGPKRARPPGIRFDDLPKIDVVLISHNHYDHLDLPSLERLAARDHPRFITGLGNSAFLRKHRIDGSTDLDWWDSTFVSPTVRVVSVPVRHFSGRGLCDRDETLWTGFVVATPDGSVYFAGDTGWGPHFAETCERYGPFRLACLPIGAFRPRWFMSPIHMSPAEAVKASIALHAETSLAMHFGTFPLGDDGDREAVDSLEAALNAAGITSDRFRVPGFGEGFDVAQ